MRLPAVKWSPLADHVTTEQVVAAPERRLDSGTKSTEV